MTGRHVMISTLPAIQDLKVLWDETGGPWAGFTLLAGEDRCDVAVIGDGFTGLSATLRLAIDGAKVSLIDADTIGFRASGRNGGQIVPGLKPRADSAIATFGVERGRRVLDVAHQAADRTFDLIARHRIDCAPTRNGWIQGAFSKVAREGLRQRAEINGRHGGDVEFLDEGRVAALTGSDFYYGGMIQRRAGAVQPLKFAHGLALSAAGASLYEKTRGLPIRQAGSGWQVCTQGGRLLADRIIIATDEYTDRLWPHLTQSLPNVTSAQLATDPLPASLLALILPARAGVSETRKITHYYRIDPAGRFVIGGRGPHSDTLDGATVQRIVRAAIDRFPQLRAVPRKYGWPYRVAITLGDLPHVHALGVWTAAGYCGRGVALAACLGEMLVTLALGLRDEDAPFPVSRRAGCRCISYASPVRLRRSPTTGSRIALDCLRNRRPAGPAHRICARLGCSRVETR
jgi:glycine/D-amino acid oxidase-like deaminating enzyme